MLYLNTPGKEVDILCFTETRLNDNHENSLLNPNGYNIVRSYRNNGEKHCRILCLFSKISFKRRSDIEAISPCVECV